MCGIPSVTLLGEKEDYLSILLRLDKLEEFGAEPTTFAQLLRPILKEFSTAFDYVEEEHQLPTPDFWNRICHWKSGGSGPTYLGMSQSTLACQGHALRQRTLTLRIYWI